MMILVKTVGAKFVLYWIISVVSMCGLDHIVSKKRLVSSLVYVELFLQWQVSWNDEWPTVKNESQWCPIPNEDQKID